MNSKRTVLSVITAVALITLTILLATSSFMANVLVPLLTGIIQIVVIIFTSPPDRTLWTILLVITIPILLLQLFILFFKQANYPSETDETPSSLKGSVQLYSEWVDEMPKSRFINGKLRKTVARLAARGTRYNSVEEMLAHEKIPADAADYLVPLTLQQRGTGQVATSAMLDETLTWIERRVEN